MYNEKIILEKILKKNKKSRVASEYVLYIMRRLGGGAFVEKNEENAIIDSCIGD
jgi:hypothetical protein